VSSCVCLSVCLSQAGVLLKRLHLGSRKQRHTIAQGLQFSCAENLGKTQTGSPPAEAPNAGGVMLNADEVAENWRLSARSVVNLVVSY